MNGFDPEGKDYDYETAKKYGLKPDKTGHWPSREPKTGIILKGRKHKTWPLTVKGESEAGFKIIFNPEDGRYYSVPSDKTSEEIKLMNEALYGRD